MLRSRGTKIGVFLGVIAGLTYLLSQPLQKPPADETIQPVFGGWIHDPEEIERVKQSLPPTERFFGDTPAGKSLRAFATEGDVLLSDAVKKLLGEHLPARDQGSIGSCVSFGVATACEYLLCLEGLRNQAGPEAFRHLVQEAIYGGSRVEIGGGRIRGDGSVTAWGGKFVKDFGILDRAVHGRFDLRVYSVPLCREWGNRGVPDELEPILRKTPIKGVSFARNAAEAAQAIRNQYTIAVGSMAGFGDRMPLTRDADGFLKRNGRWGHCMAVVGVTGGRRPGFLFVNSWGPNWVKGPTGNKDIPPGSFFVDYDTMDAMCKEGDCIVFSATDGFPVQLPWWLV